jgi:hypothetical protein
MLFNRIHLTHGHSLNLKKFLGGGLKYVPGCLKTINQAFAKEISHTLYTF